MGYHLAHGFVSCSHQGSPRVTAGFARKLDANGDGLISEEDGRAREADRRVWNMGSPQKLWKMVVNYGKNIGKPLEKGGSMGL